MNCMLMIFTFFYDCSNNINVYNIKLRFYYYHVHVYNIYNYLLSKMGVYLLMWTMNIAVDWVMMSLESQNRTNAFDVKYSVSYASQLVTKLSFYNLKTMQCIRYHHHATYLSFLLCGHFVKCPNGFAFQRLHWNILHISISKRIELSNTYYYSLWLSH